MERTSAHIKRLKAIGNRLEELRRKAGYTSYETFAYEKEVSRVQYHRMENGENFTLESLMKILDIHKITLEQFFQGLK